MTYLNTRLMASGAGFSVLVRRLGRVRYFAALDLQLRLASHYRSVVRNLNMNVALQVVKFSFVLDVL